MLERLQDRESPGRSIQNHMAAVTGGDYFACSFIKIHRMPRVPPAKAAGIVTRSFDVMDLVNLLIDSESEKAA